MNNLLKYWKNYLFLKSFALHNKRFQYLHLFYAFSFMQQSWWTNLLKKFFSTKNIIWSSNETNFLQK